MSRPDFRPACERPTTRPCNYTVFVVVQSIFQLCKISYSISAACSPVEEGAVLVIFQMTGEYKDRGVMHVKLQKSAAYKYLTDSLFGRMHGHLRPPYPSTSAKS